MVNNYVDGLARLAVRDGANVSILSNNMAVKVTTVTSATTTISSLSTSKHFAVSLDKGSGSKGSTGHRQLSSETSIMMSVTRAGLYANSKPKSSDITSNPIRLLTTCSSNDTAKATIILPLFNNQPFGTLTATNERYYH